MTNHTAARHSSSQVPGSNSCSGHGSSPWHPHRDRRRSRRRPPLMAKKNSELSYHLPLIEVGRATRFGRDWPGKRCLAKTRRGTPCHKAVLKGQTRCRLHGGRSTGPRTVEGKAGVAAAHTKHGRRSRAHVEKVRYINAELRRITYALKRDGFIP